MLLVASLRPIRHVFPILLQLPRYTFSSPASHDTSFSCCPHYRLLHWVPRTMVSMYHSCSRWSCQTPDTELHDLGAFVVIAGFRHLSCPPRYVKFDMSFPILPATSNSHIHRYPYSLSCLWFVNVRPATSQGEATEEESMAVRIGVGAWRGRCIPED
ncbi:hypothetical protein BDZ97DRAFT_769447 [Flammula alnicola]|nr:hypothetical protein BDZ97DRAFT_769447 [Flammula alnicola]